MSRAAAARSSHRAVVERMEELTLRIEALPENARPANVAQLEGELARLQGEAQRHAQNAQRLERAERARMPGAYAGGDAPRSLPNGGGRIVVGKTNEAELTYSRHGANSFYRDVFKASLDHDFGAAERLHQHAREVRVERAGAEQRVALSSTDGAGGDFVPPLWLMDEWASVIRMGRPFADSLAQRPMPPGTDSISVPRVVTGAATSAQSDLGAVQQTDATTGSYSVPVKTIAGQAAMSRTLEQQALIDDWSGVL